jgi:hypothetical protein
MKGTLEYKILKYLKENDNGEYLDMSEFISDLKLLRIKLSSLAKKPEKYISFDGGTDVRFGNGNNFKRECTLAKIEFNGIKYLGEIEKKEKTIVNIESFIGGDNYGNQSSNFSNSPQTININANIKPTEKNSLITKFWKLISESKLISGILTVIILYLIAVIFGIDFGNP